MSAVSIRLIPASRHSSTCRRASAAPVDPTLAKSPLPPKVIVPSDRHDTRRPLRPSWRYSIRHSSQVGSRNDIGGDLRALAESCRRSSRLWSMEITTEPRMVTRPDLPYVGIRVVTPFRGMLGVRDELLAEAKAQVA